jgi:hypothetical protein
MNEDNLDVAIKIYKVISNQKPSSITSLSASSLYCQPAISSSLSRASFQLRGLRNGAEI